MCSQFRLSPKMSTKFLPLLPLLRSLNPSQNGQILKLPHFLFLRCLSLTQFAPRQTDRHPKTENPKQTKPKVVPIWPHMTVKDLSVSMSLPLDHIFEAMIYVNNTNNYDSPDSKIQDLNVIREIAKKCGVRTVIKKNDNKNESSVGDSLSVEPVSRPIDVKNLKRRQPVVTIMGHVDHGKTTLLDKLRETDVAGGEAGGITQHIGAFRVQIPGNTTTTDKSNSWITFLDTPGHAAFSALRNRGAMATDIVVLVVAADDGVMEQTKESIRMAKEAGVPLIVAINKMDKPNADPDRCIAMLLQEGIQLEKAGGDVLSVEISALKGTGLNNLLDAILLQAEILDLKGEFGGSVEGLILESSINSIRGKVTTALVQRGKLRRGAYVVAGTAWGKVRGIFDEAGEGLDGAGPSEAVEVIGWRGDELPGAGEKLIEVESERRAKEIVEYRQEISVKEKIEVDAVAIQEKNLVHLKEYKTLLEQKRLSGNRYRTRRKGPRPKESTNSDPRPKLSIIVKADVDGSVESFLDVLETYDESNSSNFCRLDILSYGVGDLTESELKLAETFNGRIYLFNAKAPSNMRILAKELNVELRESRVIYRLVEELIKDLEELLPMKDEEVEIGAGVVLAGFTVTSEGSKKKVQVAGVKCTKGVIKKDAAFKLVRRDQEGADFVVWDGPASSLRHLKNDVDTVKVGVECGIGLQGLEVGTDEPRAGDTIICYKMSQVKMKCEWRPKGFFDKWVQ